MRHLFGPVLSMLLSGCSAETNLPLVDEEVELPVSTEQLVCHVRRIAAAQKLGFHYGTSEQPYGTLATFRLIADDFELIAYNPEHAHTYVLQAYDTSTGGKGRTPALRAFAGFRAAILEPVSAACIR